MDEGSLDGLTRVLFGGSWRAQPTVAACLVGIPRWEFLLRVKASRARTYKEGLVCRIIRDVKEV